MITDEVIDNFLKCEYKSYLKLHQKIGNITDYESLERELLRIYKEKFQQNLKISCRKDQILQEVPVGKKSTFPEPAYVLKPLFQSEEYTISFDAIEITQHKHLPKTLSYLPIEIVPKEKVSRIEKLSFAIKCTIVSQMRGFIPEFGKIIYGRNMKATKIHVPGYLKKVKKVLKDITQIVNGNKVHPFFQNSHCRICEFQEECKTKLLEKDDLSLLGGMKQTEVLKKNRRGIFSVLQYSYTFKPSKRKKADNKSQRADWSLKALALRKKQTYIQEIPNLPNSGIDIYLDFEGLPDENFIYLIGLILKEDGNEKHFSFWADSVEQEERIFVQLFDTLSHCGDFTIYHYGSYEINALKRFNKKLDDAYENEINRLIEKSVNILSFFSFAVYPPTYTNELKEIAQFLGFSWSEKNASGIQSIVWRRRWELSHNAEYKTTLLQYNLEDCHALKIVKEWLTNVGKNIGDEHKSFAKAEDEKAENIRKFGKTNYQIHDFEKINKYAYFDYQRNKIYLRTDKNVKKALKKKTKIRNVVNRIDKVITIYSERCSNCGHDKFYERRHSPKTVIDLKFIKGGIKKWIVKFNRGKFICCNCETEVASKNFERRSRYGHNLVAWSINQHISYRVGLNKVSDVLLESFNIYVPLSKIYTFKTRFSEEYMDTFAEIRNNMIKGNLIHADETDVTVRGFSSPYVWVFTTMDSVFYLFKPNREVEFLKELLRGFGGVLVSDFYPGYDSLSCLQQKCLIHLIRDMNNDLLSNQFDIEYKDMVISFGKLLRIIIGTVDKYGLKKRHLHKHKKDVVKFYRKISDTEYESELATKYRVRFEKNEGKLFTFLDHDSVPWNNNNAEHAIKPFARYRTDNDGVFTEKSIKEYLILLSIQQTCKYRGISFLEFLKSGEKSIEKYSQRR